LIFIYIFIGNKNCLKMQVVQYSDSHSMPSHSICASGVLAASGMKFILGVGLEGFVSHKTCVSLIERLYLCATKCRKLYVAKNYM
jgi:hypothetical protein